MTKRTAPLASGEYAPMALGCHHRYLSSWKVGADNGAVELSSTRAPKGKFVEPVLIRLDRPNGGVSHRPMALFTLLPEDYLDRLTTLRSLDDAKPIYRYLQLTGAPVSCKPETEAKYAGIDLPQGTVIVTPENESRYQQWCARKDSGKDSAKGRKAGAKGRKARRR